MLTTATATMTTVPTNNKLPIIASRNVRMIFFIIVVVWLNLSVFDFEFLAFEYRLTEYPLPSAFGIVGVDFLYHELSA